MTELGMDKRGVLAVLGVSKICEHVGDCCNDGTRRVIWIDADADRLDIFAPYGLIC